ncbi:hypothetical protein KY290_013177 [Solanum tuberosum]|uniref:Uncharacterized protein n=1 Tax=Solanum tuberosum TaxID=4113 RepID=A0ABQ7VKY8_SOLTU|nr:hypothetical protein KY290_013177 [Solanum tuberosum]
MSLDPLEGKSGASSRAWDNIIGFRSYYVGLVACPHRPSLERIAQSTSGVSSPHRPSLAPIAQSTSGVAWPHRPSLAPIAQSTSAVECPHRPRLALHWSRCRRQHADVLEFPKSKECQTPFMHNNIFIYFPSSILNVSASRGSFPPN